MDDTSRQDSGFLGLNLARFAGDVNLRGRRERGHSFSSLIVNTLCVIFITAIIDYKG